MNFKELSPGITALAILGSCLTLTPSVTLSKVDAATNLKMLIPLYSFPTDADPKSGNTYWNEVATAAKTSPKVDITVIIDPNNGPNSNGPDQNYKDGLNELRAAGVHILGYVFTGRGLCFPQEIPSNGICKATVPFAGEDQPAPTVGKIKADVDTYYNKYRSVNGESLIDGIFFDEFANPVNEGDKLKIYAELYNYVKLKNRNIRPLVVANPGTQLDSSEFPQVLKAADVFVVYENNPEHPDNGEQKRWVETGYTDESQYTSQFASLLYAAPNAEDAPIARNSSSYLELMGTYVAHAAEQGFGYVFITDNKSTSNPWSNLPSYWKEEVRYITQVNSTTVPASLRNGQNQLELRGHYCGRAQVARLRHLHDVRGRFLNEGRYP